MNRIIIEDDRINESLIDNNIKVDYTVDNSFIKINQLVIEIIDNADLEIHYNFSNEIKINVTINCISNTNVNIFEKYNNGILKVQNTYNLSDNSNINIQKFYDVNSIRQFDIINLNNDESKVDYVLKTISSGSEKYNLVVNHNSPNTISNVINNAVNINNGEVFFDVNGVIPKGMTNCTLNQNNRIVTFNEKKCQINPNLLVDENDVCANHSAFVGKFNDDDLFYLQSRGINYNDALKLLTKGFLTSNLTLNDNLKEEIESIINKYWR